MANILILNGPNLNLLGDREKDLYGRQSLSDVHSTLATHGNELGHTIHFFQSNHEGELIGRIQQCLDDQIKFIIFNPAAYTHTSIALRDALLAVNIPFIEVHITNIYKRETYRQHSYFSDIAIGLICGLGVSGYYLALRYADHYLSETAPRSNLNLLTNNHFISQPIKERSE